MASYGPEPCLRYHNKVVIVTGGTKGIGEAIVRVFVSNGASVVFCSTDPPEQIIDNTSAQEFQDLLTLNLIGYFLTAKYALPHLRKTQGNIINVSSLVGIIGQKHAIPYVATKGAVTAMTKAMSVDESQYNVRVNSISPGNIWTPMWEELSRQSADPDAMVLGGKDAQLLGRMGTPEECANAALFLAAEGTFCTGIDILLTGGAELNYANKNQQKTRSSIYD
ncbi:L-fucose dehydrogenase isoform X4 [Engystomops pustulosus]|uniref:L-fucose dehydrogenase isoform X4 n=1 Tax=Engystomops pustulosus TaxID=76066 RepID=UPI003AFA1A74